MVSFDKVSSSPLLLKSRALVHQVDERTHIRGYSSLKILSSVLLVVSIVMWYMFRDEIKDVAAQHTADVASRSLSSDTVQGSASTLSKSVVSDVLNDEVMRSQALVFIVDLLQRPETQRAAQQFLTQLTQDATVQQQLSQLLSHMVTQYLNSEHAREQLAQLAYHVLMQQSTLDAMNRQAQNVVASDSFQSSVNTLFMNSLHSASVRDASTLLAHDTVDQLLRDEAVNDHVKLWLNTLLNDPSIRIKSSEALWDVVRLGVLPRWWSGGAPITAASVASAASASASSLAAAAQSTGATAATDNDSIIPTPTPATTTAATLTMSCLTAVAVIMRARREEIMVMTMMTLWIQWCRFMPYWSPHPLM